MLDDEPIDVQIGSVFEVPAGFGDIQRTGFFLVSMRSDLLGHVLDRPRLQETRLLHSAKQGARPKETPTTVPVVRVVMQILLHHQIMNVCGCEPLSAHKMSRNVHDVLRSNVHRLLEIMSGNSVEEMGLARVPVGVCRQLIRVLTRLSRLGFHSQCSLRPLRLNSRGPFDFSAL